MGVGRCWLEGGGGQQFGLDRLALGQTPLAVIRRGFGDVAGMNRQRGWGRGRRGRWCRWCRWCGWCGWGCRSSRSCWSCRGRWCCWCRGRGGRGWCRRLGLRRVGSAATPSTSASAQSHQSDSRNGLQCWLTNGCHRASLSLCSKTQSSGLKKPAARRAAWRPAFADSRRGPVPARGQPSLAEQLLLAVPGGVLQLAAAAVFRGPAATHGRQGVFHTLDQCRV